MSDKLLIGANYPQYKATTQEEDLDVLESPYVAYSALRGFVPVIDVVKKDGSKWSFIINQTSVGKALFKTWHDNPLHRLYNWSIRVSRVAEGKMAPYKVTVLGPIC